MNRTIMLMLGVLVTTLAVVLLAGCGNDSDVPDVPEEMKYDPDEAGVEPSTPGTPGVDEM